MARPAFLTRCSRTLDRRLSHRLLLVGAVLATAACSGGDGHSGPEPGGGLLRVSAADLDGGQSGISTAGFQLEDVSTYRIRISAGPRVLIDSTFARTGPIQHEFSLAANSYGIVVEAFQSGDVLLLQGLAEATLAPDDTASVAVDLDPAVGSVEFTVAGQGSAVLPTNGTAPVRVAVRNNRGQPVSGVRVSFGLDPAWAGTIEYASSEETGPDGVLLATFVPARRESEGRMLLALDGIPVGLAAPPRFSVVSAVDANLSTVTVSNSFRLPADGASTAEIRVRVVDSAGVPQAGIPVVVRSSRNRPSGETIDVIRSSQSFTDAGGEFRAVLSSRSSSNLAGDATITVEADGKHLAAKPTVSFLSVVSASTAKITVQPLVVPAGGTVSAQIVVQITDLFRRPLSGIFVTL